MDAEVKPRRRAERWTGGHDNHFDNKEVRPYVETTSQASQPSGWAGPTYYGRSQLKAAPFNNYVVGGYIFLAGLSGGAAIVSTIAEAVRGERASGVGRRGRYVATLAPTIGARRRLEEAIGAESESVPVATSRLLVGTQL